MTDTMPQVLRESTGSAPLDDIVGGGIPARAVVVIAGEPGAGKTVLTLQALFAAARRGKSSVYFTTLSEPAVKLLGTMQQFDFFDADLAEQHIHFVDLGAAIRRGPDATMDAIESCVARHEPAFVVIDSFRALADLLHTANVRPFVYDLSVQMAAWAATTLLVGEYVREDIARLPEFAVADGIIRLGSERQGLTSVREIEVLKLRGTNYASGQHFFEIGSGGVTVYPRVRAPEDTQTQPSGETSDRMPTGIAGLDELLGGGIPRGSATIVQGGTGAGKTVLGLQFLLEGARRGERGVLFTLEETPSQLRATARSLGWDLESLERQGLLVIRHASPVELSTDKLLQGTRDTMRTLRATRAVFDSLSTMALGVPSERRFKEMVYAIVKHMRGAGVSLLMTVESDQLLGAAHLSGQGVSFVADNLIQLRYVEIGGRLERAISVLKARGVNHDSELRAYVIGQGGFDVIKDRFKDMRGVLTGLPARDGGGE